MSIDHRLTSGNISKGNLTFSLKETFSMLPEKISLPKISWNELSAQFESSQQKIEKSK